MTTIEALNKALVGKFARAEFNDYKSSNTVLDRVGEIIAVGEVDGELRAFVLSEGIIGSTKIDDIFECGLAPADVTYATESADAA